MQKVDTHRLKTKLIFNFTALLRRICLKGRLSFRNMYVSYIYIAMVKIIVTEAEL